MQLYGQMLEKHESHLAYPPTEVHIRIEIPVLEISRIWLSPRESRQVVVYLNDAGMAGLASSWAMARRRPKEYVDAATRCSGVCPHT